MENTSTSSPSSSNLTMKTAILNMLSKYKFHFIPFVLIILYVIGFYVVYYKYPSSFKEFSTITNIVFIVIGLPLFLFTFLSYLKKTAPLLTLLQYFKQIGIMSLVVFFIFGVLYLVTSQEGFSYLLTFLVNLGLAITFLGLIYVGFQKIPFLQRLKEKGFFKLLYHAIFLIPCFILDSIDFLAKDIKNTPSYIFKLLILQLVFILAYFGLPRLITSILNHKGTVLLKSPKYLDTQHVLGKYENFADAPTNNDEIFRYSYNYGISFWIFIDEQPPNKNIHSTKYTSIFNYGNKPNVLYNPSENKVKITMKTGNDNEAENIVTVFESEKHEIPLQKWNYFVINYNSGILDVFINTKLVASKNDVMPYMNYDDVISGEEEGVSGGICNVQYFKTPIQKATMALNYKALKNRKFPYV